MGVNVAIKKKAIAPQVLKRTGSLISGAAREYIADALPNVTNIAADIRSESEIIRNRTSGAIQQLRKLKSSADIRNILDWYMGASSDFMSDITPDNSSYDDEPQGEQPSASISTSTFIDQSSANTAKLGAAIINSSMKMVEAQTKFTSEIKESLTQLNASVITGFNQTNTLLSQILTVLTKNTAAIIETNMAGIESRRPGDEMLSNGRFSLSAYKKNIASNIKNDPMLGVLSAFAPMLGSLRGSLTPDQLMNTGFSILMSKVAPNMSKSLNSLDTAIGDGILKALVKLGSDDRRNAAGAISRLLGINANRRESDTSNASLELKHVAFDSVTREAIVGAIPGYLRKILVALGGRDEIYDYRSRRFTSKSSIRSGFNNAAAPIGSLANANAATKRTFGNDRFGQMLYDLVLADMGGSTGSRSQMTNRKNQLVNQQSAVSYMTMLLGGGKFSDADMKRIQQIAKNLSYDSKTGVVDELMFQAAKRNITRHDSLEKYINNARTMNVDLSGFRDTLKNELSAIRRQYGRVPEYGDGEISSSGKLSLTTGVGYTNYALYSIFKRLDTGINVYVTGQGNQVASPYPSMSDHLPQPANAKSKTIKKPVRGTNQTNGAAPSISTDPNDLVVDVDENGQPLDAGARFARWGKSRGKKLWGAIRSGNTGAVQGVISDAFSDITEFASAKAKDGLKRLNDSFGNISGYLKHKFTGKGYSYMDGDKEVVVKDNKSGGILGALKDEFTGSFKSIKEKAGGWFSRIASYFNYGSKDSEEKGGTNTKRRRFLAASVGAFAGAGLLGGPIGIIMGAIAGNAISGLDIKGKITDLLFGYKDDKNGNAKPTGILSKFADSFITPIKFQISKTLAKGAKVIEKKIIGPLSDIGFAIKERLAKAADATFGRAFRFIGKIITAPFKAAKNIITKTITGGITAVAKLTRTGMDAGGMMAGGLLGGIANIIAPDKESRKVIKERRKTRNAGIDEAYGDPDNILNIKYKDYRQKERDKLRKRVRRMSSEDVVGEQYMTEEEIKSNTADISQTADAMKETQESMAKDIAEFTSHATTTDGNHSIFTHDEGVHRYLQQIVDLLGGSKSGMKPLRRKVKAGSSDLTMPKKAPGSGSDAVNPSDITDADDFANAVVGGISSIVSANGTFTSDEADIVKKAVRESSKDQSDRSSMEEYMTQVIDDQKIIGDEKVAAEEEKESILDKIWKFLSNGLISGLTSALPIILGALGLSAFLDIDWKDVINTGKTIFNGIATTVSHIWGGIENFLSFFGIGDGGTSRGDDGGDAAVNLALSTVDASVQDKWDLLNPKKPISHVKTDAAGNDITNYAATNARNELLFLDPLRKEKIRDPVVKDLQIAWKTRGAQKYSTMADKFQAEADAASLAGDRSAYNKYQSKADKYRSKSSKRTEEAAELQTQKDELSGSATRSYRRQVAKMATVEIAGTGLNTAVTAGAKAAGLDEEQASKVGDVAQAAGTAAVIINEAKSSAKNKKSWIDKILDAGKQLLEYIGDKLKTSDKFKKLMSTKAASLAAGKIDNLISSISKCLDPSRFTDDIWNLATKLLAKVGISITKQLSATATMGITAAIGAVIGGISGNIGTEYLFQIPPGTDDALMKGISTLFGAVFGALDSVPVLGFAMLLFDVFDALSQSMFGKTIKQFLAQGLYDIIANFTGNVDENGQTNLDVQQTAMQDQVDYYNATWGTDLGVTEMNDMINRKGILDQIWKGDTPMDENGYVKTDAAGGMISNGLQQWFVGGEKKYVTGEDGKALRRSDGTAIRAVDKYGNALKEDMKWGDHLGNLVKNVGRFFTGGDVYATDENNIALVDENGDYVVESTQDNIFQRVGKAWSSAFDGLKNFGSQIVSGFTDDTETAKEKGGIAGAISTGVSTMKDLFLAPVKQVLGFAKSDEANTDYSIGDDGDVKETVSKDSHDEAGDTKKTGIGGLLSGAFSKLTSLFMKPSQDVMDVVNEREDEQYEVDDDGNTITSVSADGKTVKKLKAGDFGTFIRSGLTTLATLITKPMTDMNDAATEWNKKDAPWLSDTENKGKSIGEWVSNALGNFWGGITGAIGNLLNWNKDGSTTKGGIGGPDPTKEAKITGDVSSASSKRRFSVSSNNTHGKFGIGGAIDGNGDPIPYSSSNPYVGSLSKSWQNTMALNTQGGNPLSKDYTVTSGFHDPTRSDVHKGADIAPTDGTGEAEITATYAGRVEDFKRTVPDGTDDGSTMGNYLILRTTNPGTYGPDIIRYYHMKYNSLPSNIDVGAELKVGDKIGDVGTTGQSTGPHLHYQFERIENGVNVPFDPLSDIQGNPEANPPRNSGSAYDDTSEDGDFNGEENDEYAGPLAELLSKLSNLGTSFLNTITLGLFGNTSDSSDSSSSSSSSSSNYSYSSSVMTLDKFLALCDEEVGEKDNPAGSNNVKYNTWYYGKVVDSGNGISYQWDTTFVAWCFNEAGLPLAYKSEKAVNLLSAYRSGLPDKVVSKGERGDIAIISDDKTKRVVSGIVYDISAGTVKVYQGDSNNKVEKVSYSTSKVSAYIRPVDWEAMAAVPTDDDIGSLFNFLKSMGFDDESAAGILGNWSHESGNTPMSVESNYLNDFRNTYGDKDDPASYAKVAADIPKYSEYSKRVIQQLQSEGISLNVPYYYASDGYAYAGLGYAGWTGNRAKQLLEFAKKNGMPWYTSAAQLAFADWEMSSNESSLGPSGTNVKAKIQAATTPYDAAYTFNKWYEGIPWQEKRGTTAKEIYQKYAKGGIGGPDPVKEAKELGTNFGIGGPSADSELKAFGNYSLRTRRTIEHSKQVKNERVNAKLGHGLTTKKNGRVYGLGGPDPAKEIHIPSTSSSSYRTKSTPGKVAISANTPLRFNTPDTVRTTSSTDLSGISNILSQVVAYLQAISNNTGDSIAYLDAINQKDTTDQGLRKTISAASKAKGKSVNSLKNGTSKVARQLAHP